MAVKSQLPESPSEQIQPDRLYTYEECGRILRPEPGLNASAHIRWVKRRVAAGQIGYVEGRPRHVTGRQIIAYIERKTVPALRRPARLY